MGSTNFQINGRTVSQSDYEFFLDTLKSAGISTENVRDDQSISGDEIRQLLDQNGDQRLTKSDFQGIKTNVFQDVRKVLAKHKFELPQEVTDGLPPVDYVHEVVESTDGVSVYGMAKTTDGVCCSGRVDRVAPKSEPAKDNEPVVKSKTGKGRGTRKTTQAKDYYAMMDDTYGPGTGMKMKLSERARRKAVAELGPKGDRLLTYNSMDLKVKVTVGGATLTIDPSKQTITPGYGWSSKDGTPLSANSAIQIDYGKGEFTPSVGGKVGATSIVAKPEGIEVSVNGIKIIIGYDFQIKGAEMKPTLSAGPLMVQADSEQLHMGATLKLDGGVVKVEYIMMAHFDVDHDVAQDIVIDGVDAFYGPVTDGQGVIRPLLEALDPQ